MKRSMTILLAMSMVSACAQLRPDHQTLGAGRCADVTAQVYFEPASAEVSPEGRGVINSAAGVTRHCRVTSVDLIAPADAAGDPEVDPRLSQRRVAAVTAALAAAGLRTEAFRVAAPTPIRRRADIVIHLVQP